MRTYKVGDREYVLNKLVMGQIIELAEYLAEIDLELKGIDDVKTFIVKNLKHLPRMLAIVLVPKDVPLPERDISKEEAYLFAHLEYDQMVEVIQDFLALHDLIALMERITALIEAMTGQIAETSERR